MKFVWVVVRFILAWLPLIIVPALWMLSYQRNDAIVLATNSSLHALTSSKGRLIYADTSNTRIASPPNVIHVSGEDLASTLVRITGVAYPSTTHWTGIGSEFRDLQSGRSRLLILPYWTVAAPPLIYTICIAIAAARKHIRPRLGLCAHCGYDLRATPDRCPECGRPALTSPPSELP